MTVQEIFNNHNEFYLETGINNLRVFKSEGKLFLETEWNINEKHIEVEEVKEKNVLRWLDRNKDKERLVLR